MRELNPFAAGLVGTQTDFGFDVGLSLLVGASYTEYGVPCPRPQGRVLSEVRALWFFFDEALNLTFVKSICALFFVEKRGGFKCGNANTLVRREVSFWSRLQRLMEGFSQSRRAYTRFHAQGL